MADDFARQLLDALYNPETQPPQQPSRPLREKLAGAAETVGTLGSGLLASVPAGLAGLTQLIPTRGHRPSVNRAAQKVEDVQSALTYLPRGEAGQEYLEKTAGALGMLGAPAEFLGEQTLKLTGSPFLATTANVGLDPVNYIGIPGTGKALVSGTKAAGRTIAAAPRVAGEMAQDLMMGQGRIQGQRGAFAFHGSPHKFAPTERNPLGEFDPTKLGTGEGNQSYGVGAYLAESPEVAKDYRDNLSNFLSFVDGQPFDGKNPAHRAAMEVKQRGGTDEARKEAIEAYKRQIEDLKNRKGSWASELAKAKEEELPFLESGKIPEYTEKTTGNLYKVDVPDEMIGKMLDWDKPLSEQPKEVQEALKNSGVLNAVESFGQVAAQKVRQLAEQPGVADWAKRDLLKDAESIENSPSPKHIGGVLKRMPLEYGISRDSGPFSSVADDFLTFSSAADFVPNLDTGGGLVGFLQALNGKKEASEILQNAGIPGIKYLDQGSRSSFKVQNSVKGKPYGDPVSFATEQQAKDYASDQAKKGFQTEILPGTRNFVVFPAEQKNLNIVERKKEGGSVHISDNPDTMALELAAGGAVAAAKAAAKAAEKAIPPKLPRAAPKTKAEIEAIAQRMAPQLTGEYVRKSPESAITVAGKTKRQFEREKELPVKLTGEERTPEQVGIESMKDKVAIGILGDPSITGRELESVGDIRLGLSSPQHGGPLYGMGRDEEFWASGKGAAQKVQNLAEEAGKQYDTDVLGKYIMMGPEGLNYALHFADANLQAIDTSKMTKRQIEEFNKLIRRGSPDSGPRPSFPGIEDKVDAYLQFAIDPKLRIHFNSLMQMPTVTEAFNLPSGQDIRFAITEPSLRDLERGVAGMSIGQMRPGAELTQSLHPTYEMDIPGKFMGSSKYPIPYELMFPDTVKAIRSNPRQAPHEFGSLGMVGPRQIIDQQMIDELKAYEEQIRKLTGKKKGGAVKKQAGGAIKAAVKAAKPTAEQAAKMAEQRAELVLRSRAMQELKDQFENLPQPPKGFLSPENILQRMDEIRRREATPSGEQIPLLKKGGAVEMQAGGALKAAAKAAERAAKAAKPEVLTAAERDANLAKMLEASQVKSPLYHSSRSPDIDTFYSWSHLGTKKAAEDRARQIMQTNPEGVTTYPVYALVKNPLRTEDLGLNQMGFWNLEKLIDSLDSRKVDFSKWSGGKKGLKADYATDQDPSIVEDFLRRNGYDSIVYRNQAEDPGSDSYIIFNPKNIKSATGNRGTFDVTRPEITKKRGGKVSITDNLDTMRLAVQKRK